MTLCCRSPQTDYTQALWSQTTEIPVAVPTVLRLRPTRRVSGRLALRGASGYGMGAKLLQGSGPTVRCYGWLQDPNSPHTSRTPEVKRSTRWCHTHTHTQEPQLRKKRRVWAKRQQIRRSIAFGSQEGLTKRRSEEAHSGPVQNSRFHFPGRMATQRGATVSA